MNADDSDALNKDCGSETASRMHCVIEKFKAMWTSFLASSEAKGCLTNRGADLVEVEKLRSETFAELVGKEMPDKDGNQWKNARIAVDYDNKLRPVLFAKIVTTGKPLLPRLYKRQTWSLLKKYERVLVLFVHKGISSLDEAITLSDLSRVYEEYGAKMFARSVPWIGVGAAQEPVVAIGKGRNNDDEEFRPILGNRVDSVRFDETISAFVVQATDWSIELCLSYA